jgi:large subunit ribosomal protein L23
VITNPRDLIRHYLTTEKNTALKDATNVYVFEVVKRANKSQVKSAVEQVFGVHVIGVNMSNSPHKPKRLGRHAGRRSGFKKAFVTLKQGDAIQVFENV